MTRIHATRLSKARDAVAVGVPGLRTQSSTQSLPPPTLAVQRGRGGTPRMTTQAATPRSAPRPVRAASYGVRDATLAAASPAIRSILSDRTSDDDGEVRIVGSASSTGILARGATPKPAQAARTTSSRGRAAGVPPPSSRPAGDNADAGEPSSAPTGSRNATWKTDEEAGESQLQFAVARGRARRRGSRPRGAVSRVLTAAGLGIAPALHGAPRSNLARAHSTGQICHAAGPEILQAV